MRAELVSVRKCVPGAGHQVVTPLLQRAYPAQVIDLGCGTGLLGMALADLKANLVGIRPEIIPVLESLALPAVNISRPSLGRW